MEIYLIQIQRHLFHSLTLVHRICCLSFEYFLSLEAAMHRESWIPVIILILSNLLRLPEEKVSIVT